MSRVGLFGLLVFFVSLGVVLATPLQGGQAGVDAYAQERSSLPYAARLGFAESTLSETADPQVAALALQDVLGISQELGKSANSARIISEQLSARREGDPLYGDLYYAHALVQHRLGNAAQAVGLFQAGIANDIRPAHAELLLPAENYREVSGPHNSAARILYWQSLQENDVVSFAIERFNYMAQDRSRTFYAQLLDHFTLFNVDNLWAGRHADTFSAMDEVHPNLESIPGAVEHQGIARLMCALIDKQYDAARETLHSLTDSPPANFDTEAASPEELFRYNERFNIPLYEAATHLLEGANPTAVETAMERFWTLNNHRPRYVLQKLLNSLSAGQRSDISEFPTGTFYAS